jgi:alkylated DNA repair dioxygenase AlkB
MGSMVRQTNLFSESTSAFPQMPEGFRYQAEIISEEEEATLVAVLQTLDLKPFEFHGHAGNRRVASFGFRYDYGRQEVETADEPPAFLSDLRKKAAEFAGRAPEDFRQFGINEYRASAGIGWHRDRPQFGDVVGISLASPAKLRLRKRNANGWIRRTQLLEPRSIYILRGESRRLWEHSIPPQPSLRYSVMFRTLAISPDAR